jgi:hypothetical protein
LRALEKTKLAAASAKHMPVAIISPAKDPSHQARPSTAMLAKRRMARMGRRLAEPTSKEL